MKEEKSVWMNKKCYRYYWNTPQLFQRMHLGKFSNQVDEKK